MRISLLAILLLVISQNNWAAAKIEHWQTATGSRVYYVQTTGLPMVDIHVAFAAGSARDGKEYGLSALSSAMLDTGAGQWDADEIAQRLESVGAQFGTGISRDMGWLSLRTLTQPKLFDKAVETMHVVLSQPTFNAEDFTREKNRTLAGLKRREESPGAIAKIAFYKALYGEHPYAHPQTGFVDTVTKFTVADVQRFYQQYYVAANAVVVIVGDVSRETAAKTAEQLMAGLPKGRLPEPIPMVTVPKQGNSEHIEFPSKQTHVLSGLPGIHRKDVDYFPLYVGNHILGGGGLVSMLFNEVREKRGLAYSASSHFSPLLRKGPFTMGLQTRNDEADKAVKVLIETLRDFVRNGPSAEQLTAAKKNITGGFVMRFDTNSKLTSYVTMIAFYQLPLDFLDTYPGKVDAVTAEDIKAAFKRRIDPDLLQTITVGHATEKGAE